MWRRAWFRAALVIGALLLLLAFGFYRLRVSSRRELAAWKREMRRKGERFEVKELVSLTNGLGLTPAQWLGRENIAGTPSFRGELTGMVIVEPGVARVRWNTNTYERPTGANWEQWLSDLDAFSNQIASIRSRLKDPPRDLGWDYSSFSTFPNSALVEYRNVSQWLASAAVLELHRNNGEAALANLISLLQFAQAYDQEMTVMWQMMRSAIVRLAVSTTWQALQWPALSESDST
jgi:hypothetical protein